MKMASLVAPLAVTATSIELVPGWRLTLAVKAPPASPVTVVIVVEGADAPGAVPVTAMSTVAPAAVVPVTVVVAASTVAPGRVVFAGTLPPATGTGAVTCSGATAGGVLRPAERAAEVYRSATMDGCSTSDPAARSAISRSSWACAQVSGAADPSAAPLVKPMDAVAGSDPYGEAGRSG